MIRAATFSDIPRLTQLVGEMHARSRYAALTSISPPAVKTLLEGAVQHSRGARSDRRYPPGATFVAVAGDPIDAFIIGMLSPHYEVCERLSASDVLFYATDAASPRSAPALLDAMIQWAESNPRVATLRFAVTDAIGDPERAGRLYERRGFRASGTIYERTVG